MGRGKAKIKGEKFQMSPSEIVQMYKEAKEKSIQIKILAELNLCSQDEIKAILRENGIRLPGGVKKEESVKTEVENDVKSEIHTESDNDEKCYSNVNDLKRIEELEAEIKELKSTNEDLEDEASSYLKGLAEIESLTEILLSVDLTSIESFKGIDLLLRQIKDCCRIY